VTVEVLVLIAAMGALTYALRVAPLLLPLHGEVLDRASPYLRLVAPAVLSALAALSALVVTEDGRAILRLDAQVLPILAGLALVAWRGNLALGIVAGVSLAFGLRSL